jgi:hypothetical protein
MICLSLSICGVEGFPKNLALKILVKVYALDVILLQETMCNGSKVEEVLASILKNWSFYSMDFDGLYGGLMTTWSPCLK